MPGAERREAHARVNPRVRETPVSKWAGFHDGALTSGQQSLELPSPRRTEDSEGIYVISFEKA